MATEVTTRLKISAGTYSNSGESSPDDLIFHAPSVPSEYGGAIRNYGEKIDISKATFSGNTAASGGAIYNSTGAAFLSNVNITSNCAMKNGGGIRNMNTLEFSTGNCVGNWASDAAGRGGFIDNTGTGTAHFSDVNFKGNYAVTGGAINNSGVLNVENGTFLLNGAIYDENNVVTEVKTSIGGAINITNIGTATITNANFSSNCANQGGAINNGSKAAITGGVFYGNTATNYGGAIFNAGASLEITANKDDTENVVKVIFEKNTAVSGGAIFNSKNATIDGADFSANTATLGGAMFLDGTATGADIKDADFTANIATNNGGAIYNVAVATVTNGTFSANTATTYGGAIYNKKTTTINDAKFISNYASTNGGAIYNYSSGGIATIEINGGSFTTNSAKGSGGAIWNSSGNATIVGVTFSGNHAATGGAIMNYGTVTLSNTTFDNNTAQNGGAIYNYKGGAIVNLNGGNIFATNQDIIVNRGTMNIKGANTFGARVATSGGDGLTVFDENAVTTLTGSAYFKIVGASQTQTANGMFVLRDQDGDAVHVNGDNNALDYKFFEGDESYVWTFGENFSVKVGETTLSKSGDSFVNENGVKLWYVNDGGNAGITNYMQVNTTFGEEDLAAFNKYASIAALNTAIEDFDGVINVIGGDFSGAKTFGGDASLLLNGGNFGSKYVFGGSENEDGRNKFVTIDGTITTNKAIYAGNQYLSSFSGAATLEGASKLTVKAGSTITTTASNLFLVAGSLFNGSSTVTDNGTHEMTIDSAVTSKYLIGTNVMGGNSIVTTSGSVKMNISAGNYTCVAGSGYIQSDSAAITQKGNVTMNITGGTYQFIFGGVAGSDASYVANAKLGGNVNITVDTTKNNVSLQYLFAGNSGTLGKLNGNATVTFTGDGSKLTFAGAENTVNGGNAATDVYKVSSALKRTLVFDAFSGEFGADYIESFSHLKFSKGSTVTFSSTSIDLAEVSNWNFENGTSLNWAEGTNDFEGDNLVFGKAGDTLAADWTVIAGGDGLFTGLDAAAVTIFGEEATKVSGDWSTDKYKLFVDGNSLKIGALATEA